ncbi:MAG TPA: ATP-binding protein [Candidatus Sulfotelmatobacter sp.]|jgi:heavy metal sensor kinase|nr:ATP-binding protein [Candidatus Sulfotelmatobacter sp.]
MNFRSISFRLIAWYAGLLAAIFLLLSGLLYLDLRLFLENDLRQAQLRRAHQVANTLLARVQQTGEPYVVSQTRDWYSPEINDRFIRITRGDGTVLYASGRPKDDSFDPSEVPVPGAFSQTDLSRKVKLSNGKTLSTVALNYQPAGQTAYVIEFGELLDPVETMLGHLFLQLAIGLPVAVLFIAGGGYWLLRRALTPVEQITRAAESITQQNLTKRLPVAQTGDELERLSISLNRMIARLDEAFQNSQRFVADASHDLRTPLTVLRGELESLHDDARLDPVLRERVANILEEAVHFSKIVEQLFLLSRLDAGEGRAEWTRFDLAELARNTADQLSLLAEDKKISITCDAPQAQLVEGDSVRLKQVIVNLLDNAIKYTPEKGAIQLRVHGRTGHVVLEVEDNGIGISAEALPHIFERFYRVDKARSSENESAGLGLSIVKSICAAHGAQVEAQSTAGRGSCFRVTLAAAKN